MVKIENVAKKAPAHMFEVLVSFNGLNRGDTFTQEADDLAWAGRHVTSGYLRDLGEVEADGQRGESGQG